MNRIELYKYAKERIESYAKKCNVSQERLETVYYQPNHQAECSDKMFYLFCGHLADRQYMGNIIKFYYEGSDTPNLLKKVLLNYDPKEVIETYCNAEEIMAEIKKVSPSKIQNEDKWKEYLTGIYQCAEFLTSGKLGKSAITFNNLLKKPADTDEFKKYLHGLRPVINNLTGVGSAVCYNWLKESGAVWLAKPDLHIKRIVAGLILKQLESDKSIIPDSLDIINDTDKIIRAYMDNYTDETRFPANSGINKNCRLYPDEFVAVYMFKWAEEIRSSGIDNTITPFKLDRILYLYCTNGNFYLEKNTEGNISEEDLLNKIRG